MKVNNYTYTTITSIDTNVLTSDETISIVIVDGKFDSAACSNDYAIMNAYTVDNELKATIRNTIIDMVNGNTHANVWHGKEDGWNIYLSIKNGVVTVLKDIDALIRAFNANEYTICIDYDADVE